MTNNILTLESISPISIHLLQLGLEVAPKIIWAVGILVITRFGISFVSRVLHQVLSATQPTLQKFIIQAAEILTLVFGAIAALNLLGIQTASVVAVLGAAGLAVGLALQNTLSHFAAEVMLISLRPFEVGDEIEGAGVCGEVDSIGIFSTTLITEDYVKITVPNGKLFADTLKNNTTLGKRRVDLKIDIGDRLVQTTTNKLLTLVQAHPLVLEDPKPTCNVDAIAIRRTIISLRPWCKAEDYKQVRAEILQKVKEALQEIEDV